MKRTLQLLLVPALCLGTGLRGAQDTDKPTHKEIDPIRIPLGQEGHLKTIGMDRNGNLLVGVSWLPEGASPARGGGKRADSSDEAKAYNAEPRSPEATRKLVTDAAKAGTPEAWAKVIKEVAPQEFREAMMQMDQATRRPIMMSLPPEVRQKLAPAFGRPGGPGPRGGPGGQMSNDRGGLLPNLTLDAKGHVYALKVVSPEGKVLSTWSMKDGLEPKMIDGASDGTVYVAGGGRLVRFDEQGKVLKSVDTDKIYGQKALASGLYVSDKHVFIAFGMGNSLRATEDIYRFNRDLEEPVKIVERQFGCCSHIDLEVLNGQLLIAENSRHRVNTYDLDGKQTGTWGKRDRESLEGFAACCNPCNTDIGPGGAIYTAESGVGRVKKYSGDGKFLGLVGYVDTTKFDNGSQLAAQSCYIPIEVNKDASRIYVMDVRAHIIRVLAQQK